MSDARWGQDEQRRRNRGAIHLFRITAKRLGLNSGMMAFDRSVRGEAARGVVRTGLTGDADRRLTGDNDDLRPRTEKYDVPVADQVFLPLDAEPSPSRPVLRPAGRGRHTSSLRRMKPRSMSVSFPRGPRRGPCSPHGPGADLLQVHR